MDNVGGLVKLYICLTSNLSDTDMLIDKSELIEIPFTSDTGERKCTRKSDKNGEYYELKITCVVPRSDADNHYAEILQNNFAIISVDSNGITRLDGNKNEPLRYEIESDTGKKFEDLNSVNLEFSRKLRFPSPVIVL